ncbi:UbiA family prenyltransferase [Bradyrhizobium sp.]|uniref:UbiA family prenyltransferase n=1 Tax=Bradyrhizobium sp. TaxID=376 RepID=UPI0023A5474F|nr:UbiA family prenyltransferase [Bradyrhizobium sp.]MDE2380485.1 UbiA family prenyltransferase [Bradyrhizobium sp.]
MEQALRQHAPDRPEAAPSPAAGGRALVIDLEGALLRSDLAWEALFADLGRSLARLWAGRSPNKPVLSRVLARARIDYAHLPYDADVLNRALAARARGEKVYLAARRFEDHAAAISAHLGFDGVIARADALPVAAETVDHVSGQSRRTDWRTWLRALRVYQYAKNTLVFVPLVTAHQMSLEALGDALLAFFAFSACASGAYLMNDLLDLVADRAHPTKRHRPLAAGQLPIAHALAAIPALWLAAVAASLCISGLFVAVLGAYLATTIAYSLFLKRKMLLDVVTLAGLYTLRIIAGAVGAGVVLSEWLLMFSLFVFTSLALIKRYSELTMRQGAGLSDPANRDYRVGDLQVIAAMAAASGMNAVIVFSLYVSSSAVTPLYSRPWMLWLMNPPLLYWFGRALMMAHRREMPDDPILYTFRDNASRITVAAMIFIMLAAI